MIITTGLPQPTVALNGIKIRDSEDYSVLLVIPGGGYVARDFNKTLTIVASNGITLTFSNAICSDIYESNVVLSNGRLYFLIRNITNDIVVKVVDAATGSVLGDQGITNEPVNAFPSISMDHAANRLWVYKGDISAGTAGFAYVISIDTSVAVPVATYHQFGNVAAPANSTVHLYSDNGVHYRSFTAGGASKISRLNQTTLDAQIYQTNPSAGEVLIQNISSDIYYPFYRNNRIYVLSKDGTKFSAWSTTAANTQLVAPFIIDTRADLAVQTRPIIGYPRFQFDTSTNLLFDTRTYLIWDTAANAQQTTQYPICPPSSFPLSLSDLQPIRLLSSGESYVAGDFYDLNTSIECPFEEVVNVEYQNIEDGALTIPFTRLEEHVGRLDSSTAVYSQPVFFNDQLEIGADLSFTSIVVNGSSYSLPGDLRTFSQIEYNNKYYVRTSNDLRVYDGTAQVIIAATPLAAQVNRLIFNNKLFVFATVGLSIFTLGAVPTETYYGTAWLNPQNVKLFTNSFTKELLLFNRALPTQLRKLNFEPAAFDFTNPSVVGPYSTVVTNSFPSAFLKNTVSTRWSIQQVSPVNTAYFDESGQLYEITAYNSITISQGSYGVASSSAWEIASPVTQVGKYIFNRNSLDVIIIRNPEEATKIALLEFIKESDTAGAPQNTTLAQSPDSVTRPAVGVNSNGYLQMIFPGASVIGGNPSRAYTFIYDRTFPVVAQPVLLPNNLRLNYLSNTKGKVNITLDIDQLEIVSYKVNPVELPTVDFGRKTEMSEAKITTYEIDLEAVLDTEKLLNISNMFYSQWADSADDQKWEIAFLDGIYPVAFSNYRTALTTPVSANVLQKFVSYKVAIIGYSTMWFSDEKYKITIKLREI